MNDFFRKAFDLSGQTALITGGGSGIGLAIAKCLHSAGANVVLAGRREEVLAQACRELGNGAYYRVHDITRTEQAKPFIQELEESFGSVDILIHNAGRHCKKEIEDIEIQDFRNLMDVHLYGAFALTQAAYPYMKARGHGRVVFISSESALLGLTKVSVYGAAKSALLGITRCLAGDLSREGIRVNAIVPGFIDTPMFHQVVDKDLPRQQKILGHTPMYAYGTPEDIGWTAVYLCAPASKFVTGTVLTVDGGCSIGF